MRSILQLSASGDFTSLEAGEQKHVWRLLVAAYFLAVPALAWPVDWVHDVEAGKEKFVKLPSLDWFESDDPSTVSVEWFPEANELLLVGHKPGRATVLLGAEGKVAAWTVRVSSPPMVDAAVLQAAKKACPDFRVTPREEVKLTVTVLNEPCQKALMALFQTDAFEARHLNLTFEGKVLQAQLKEVQEAIHGATRVKVRARYVGAGLVLEGTLQPEQHRKMLWAILHRTLGRFALDDQTHRPP